ncbi:MAG: hypothetical protein ACJ8AW_47485 [Rhodopila sp.]
MGEALTYLSTITLFSFVTIASALIRHEMLLLACIPAVFVALIMGFVMMIYTQDTFGWPLTIAALAVGVAPAWFLARRLGPKDLLIAIYLGWAVALVLVLVAVGFPDREAPADRATSFDTNQK